MSMRARSRHLKVRLSCLQVRLRDYRMLVEMLKETRERLLNTNKESND